MDAQLVEWLKQIGANVILAVPLWALWGEYKAQGAFIRELLKQADAERSVLAHQLGMTTTDLKNQALVVRQRLQNEHDATSN